MDESGFLNSYFSKGDGGELVGEEWQIIYFYKYQFYFCFNINYQAIKIFSDVICIVSNFRVTYLHYSFQPPCCL